MPHPKHKEAENHHAWRRHEELRCTKKIKTMNWTLNEHEITEEESRFKPPEKEGKSRSTRMASMACSWRSFVVGRGLKW
eukprot:scaffold48222_cov30-Tisochrysis_lutea.AAC.5